MTPRHLYPTRRASLQWLIGSALVAAAPLARAAWPTRTVRIVLPFVAGGTSDVVARLLAEKLSASLGQTVIVEPRPGANGIIASDAVAKSVADGHTLLMASAAHASNASLYAKLPYDSVRDFTPVALVAPPGPMVIAVNAGVPVRSVRELIDHARANPGKVAYASAGIGNTLHLAGEMFCQMSGVQMLHVPYKGAAPALNDLAGGQVQLMFNSALAVAPLVKEGRLRLIAQTGLKRSPALPADLPTVAESGLPGFQVTGWFGLFAPARTPAEAVQRLNAEVNRAMALPELRDKLALLGSSEVPTLDPDAFGAFVNAETARYAGVIKAAGIALDTPTQ
jgi:tripartite-type tricarboxylate transporter receptor subunit TctC